MSVLALAVSVALFAGHRSALADPPDTSPPAASEQALAHAADEAALAAQVVLDAIEVRRSTSIDLATTGDIAASGFDTAAIFAASSRGDVSISSLGDLSSAGDHAGGITATARNAILIDSTGAITTEGDGSTAILAQSSRGDVTIATEGDLMATGDDATGVRASGRTGVDVSVEGIVLVTGDDAMGISASSSKGDTAVASDGVMVVEGANATGIAASGTTLVEVASLGDIVASGDSAIGIHAQSSRGDIDINSTGNLDIFGDGATGISASGSDVSIVTSGDVRVEGQDSVGLHVSSSGDTSVVIDGGLVSGGEGGAGVLISSLGHGVLENEGTILAGGGTAIVTTGGDGTVLNRGTVIGNIDLAEGDNTVLNEDQGLLIMGDQIDLGGGTLTNSGSISPGLRRELVSTTIEGSLIQDEAGQLRISADMRNGASDQLEVTGHAVLDGTISATILNPVAGTQEFTIVSAADGLDAAGLEVADTLAVQVSVAQTSETDLTLSVDVDYSPQGVAGDASKVGDAINAMSSKDVGTESQTMLAQLSRMTDVRSYQAALAQFVPQATLGVEDTLIHSSLNFSKGLLSCHNDDASEQLALASPVDDGPCIWANDSSSSLNSALSASSGFTSESDVFSGGTHVMLNKNWRLGAAAGWDQSLVEAENGMVAGNNTYDVGTVLRYHSGSNYIAAMLNAGSGSSDTARPVDLVGEIATSERDVSYTAARLHAAHLWTSGGFFVMPKIDVAATYMRHGRSVETGAPGANLIIEASEELVYSVNPGVELGFQMRSASGTIFRPTMRFDLFGFAGNDPDLKVRFADAPEAGYFTVSSNPDTLYANLGVGLDILTKSGPSLGLQYESRISENTESHTATFKFSAEF